MNHDLIERYLYAVTKRLNPKIREDVADELHSLIDDMLAERCGDLQPTEKDIRVVLTELGSPQELYVKYDEDAGKSLIGQPYYSTYKFVMKIALAGVAVGMTVACLILQLLEPQIWYFALGSWISMLCEGLVVCFAFVTLLFAFFQHRGVKLQESFDLGSLPPVPKKKQQIEPWKCAADIVLTLVFLVVFLVAPQTFSAVLTEKGELIPVFDVEVIRSNWYLIVLFAGLGIFRETVKLLEKRFNGKVLAVSVVVNVLSAVLAFLWLGGSAVINPVFKANIAALFAGESEFILQVFSNFNLFFLGVMLLALVMDTVNAVIKSLEK